MRRAVRDEPRCTMRRAGVRRQLVVASLFVAAVMPAWAQSTTPRRADVAPQAGDGRDQAAGDYIANDAQVTQVFDALAASLGKPIVASASVRRKRVSGRFDVSRPQRVLDRLCSDMGLVSYFDGNVVYVYDMSELTNAMGTLKWIDVGALRAFLDEARIASSKFPVRGDTHSHTFYVAGPPVYVEAVLAAARNLDHARVDAGGEQESAKVVTLKHTFVRDRVFKLRDQVVTVPGVATVLAQMLQDRRDGDGLREPGISNAIVRDADVMAASTGHDTRPGSLPAPLPGIDGIPAKGRASPMPRVARGSQRPVVLAYPDTNSLLIEGDRTEIDYLSRLISQLDVEKTQIELSLWIIDIDQSTLEQMGVRWQGAFNGGPIGLTFNGGNPLASGGLSTLDGARFLASVFALNQKGEAQIVSRPLVLTQENVPAIFDNNQTFYARLIGERTTNLQEVTYGTLVSVIPRLSIDHGDIEMILDIEDGKTVDNAQEAATVDDLPVVGRTHISTIARVPREMSLLIGGYTRHEVDADVTRVPLLSDIPLLGALFRYKKSTVSDRVRVFLIQPRVLASREIWQGPVLDVNTDIAPGVSARDAVTMFRDAVTRDAEPAASIPSGQGETRDARPDVVPAPAADEGRAPQPEFAR